MFMEIADISSVRGGEINLFDSVNLGGRRGREVEDFILDASLLSIGC